jgi:hypothetical protein
MFNQFVDKFPNYILKDYFTKYYLHFLICVFFLTACNSVTIFYMFYNLIISYNAHEDNLKNSSLLFVIDQQCCTKT